MLFAIKYLIASTFVIGGVAIVMQWLFLLQIAADPEGGLLPWTAAGAIAFGLPIVFIAGLLSLPGLVWVKHLANRVRPGLRLVVMLPRTVGITVLLLGLAVAVVVLVLGRSTSA